MSKGTKRALELCGSHKTLNAKRGLTAANHRGGLWQDRTLLCSAAPVRQDRRKPVNYPTEESFQLFGFAHTHLCVCAGRRVLHKQTLAMLF